jgi:type II secretory pathway component PulM
LWQQRQPRERVLIGWTLAVLALLLLWTTTLQPAWRLWQQPPTQSATHSLAVMRSLQAQAQALRQQPRISTTQSRLAVSQSIQALGGKLSPQGSAVVVELPATATTALFGWVESLGPQMGARVIQASLQEIEPGQWSGRLTLELP